MSEKNSVSFKQKELNREILCTDFEKLIKIPFYV